MQWCTFTPVSFTIYLNPRAMSSSTQYHDDLVVGVAVVNPRVGSTYTVKVFTSSSSSGRPDSEEHLQSFASDAIAGQALRHGFNTPPRLLHVWLYSNVCVPRLPAVSVTSVLATGHVPYADVYKKGGVEMELIDVTSSVQGRVTIRSTNAPSSTPAVVDVDAMSSARLTLFKSVSTAICGKYTELTDAGYARPADDRSRFYYVQTNMSQLPITTYAFMSTLIDNTDSELHDLLVGMLRHVNTTSNSSSSLYDQLVDLCTLLPRMLLYTDDIVRRERGRDQVVDQWTQLGTMPNMSTSGFDCEDGSGLVMSIVHALRSFTCKSTTPPRLVQLQQLARQYTAFLTIGNLKSGDVANKYVSHAYVVMLDSEWVTQHMSGGPTPASAHRALTLESTASVSGVWDGASLARVDERSPDAVSSYLSLRVALRAAFKTPALFTTCRQRTPLQAANARIWNTNPKLVPHRGPYQDVYVLMSPSHQVQRNGQTVSDNVIHLLVTGINVNGGGVIGALAENVMTYNSQVTLHTVSNETRAIFKERYMSLWSEQPRNKLPLALPSSSSIVTPPPRNSNVDIGYIDISARIWLQYEREFVDYLSPSSLSSSSYVSDTSEPLHDVAVGLSFKRVYFART